MLSYLKKFWIELLIFSVFIYVLIDQITAKDLASHDLYSVAFATISLLLVSIRTKVLLDDYKEKVRGRVFNEYHKLIRVINGIEDYFNDEDKTPAREVQCAAIFELRNYPEYKDFTQRTLNRWKEKTDEEWDEIVNQKVDKILDVLKKEGRTIPENIKNELNPILRELKKKKRSRYNEEIEHTLSALELKK